MALGREKDRSGVVRGPQAEAKRYLFYFSTRQVKNLRLSGELLYPVLHFEYRIPNNEYRTAEVFKAIKRHSSL